MSVFDSARNILKNLQSKATSVAQDFNKPITAQGIGNNRPIQPSQVQSVVQPRVQQFTQMLQPKLLQARPLDLLTPAVPNAPIVLKTFGYTPPTFQQIGQTLQKQGQDATQRVSLMTKQGFGQKLTPQEQGSLKQLTMPEIGNVAGTTGEGNAITRKLTSANDIENFVLKNKEALKKVYRENNIGKFLNTDNVREVFTPIGYNRKNSALYHQEAGKLTNELFNEDIAKLKPGDKYLFTGGSSGAGKSSSLDSYPNLMQEISGGFDGNFSSDASIDKMRKVIDKGADASLLFTAREPVDAWMNGVVKRALDPKNGRVVPLNVFLDNFENSVKKTLEAKKLFGDKFKLHALDNNYGANGSKYIPEAAAVDFLKNLKYNGKEYEQQLINETVNAYKNGTIKDEETFRRLLGDYWPRVERQLKQERSLWEKSSLTKIPSSNAEGVSLPNVSPEQQLQSKQVPQIAQLSKGEYPKDSQQNSTINPSGGIISQETQDYLKKLTQDQAKAKTVEKGGILQKANSFISDVKRKLVDSTAPIEDILASAQKQGKFQVLPSKDISNQIDRSIRSRELASQFLKDNGMVDVIKNVPDINALDQYLIAKHAPEVETAGFKTGRNTQADAQLVKELAPTYEPFAQKVTQYGQKLLDYATESGLVSKETATMLKQKYPNYVPINRIFNELEKGVVPEGVGKGVASLSRQTVIKGLQGSERAIHNPTETLLTKTLDAFSQGERNQAGQMLASYKDLPGNPFQLRELKPGESATHTVSYLDNGVKKTFETTPEIAQAAKFLDKRQLGLIGQIFATPVRLARIGITGINVPFTASNIAKDQVSGIINSDHALQTSILGGGGQNFIKSLWSAVGHGKAYDEWIRSAGGGTSFDISRSAPQTSIAQIRAGRSVSSKIAYTATHPDQLLRAVEGVISRSEELTRLQQFQGTKQALLKEGRTPRDATILAAKASRENTVNFARSGDWGKALNSVFLYMNAGIQGSRTLVRNLQTRPVQTAAKIGLTVFTPLATVTAWNMSDPKRLEAYNDIRDYEKDSNLIIIPPNPTKDPKTGKWNVIKVPFSQEVANLTIPVRKSIEALHGADPPSFMDISAALLGSATSLNTQSPNALVGQFIPQAVKPELEATLNKNLFTGADIVPQYINGSASKDLPPELQARPDTSGTARAIGRVIKSSPLKVEQFVKSSFGGVGSQIINASDQALAAVGAIPKEQVGGQSIQEGLGQRFVQGSGGKMMDKVYNDSTKVQTINTQAKKLLEAGRRDEALKLIRDNKDLLMKRSVINAYRKEVDTYNGYKNKVRADQRLTPEQRDKILGLIQKKLDAISAQYSASE